MSYYVAQVSPENQQVRSFLDFLQSKNSHAVGFLTYVALSQAITRGRVMTAFENGDRAGYVIHGKVRENTRILQIVVADDARRVEHATALVDAVTRLANAVRAHSISLHCAQDLEANRFWKAIGFKIAGKRLRDKRGRRWQNKWVITLPGAAEDAILKSKRLDVAGISALHRLLVKGDARIGDVDFARFRSSKHHLLMHADDA